MKSVNTLHSLVGSASLLVSKASRLQTIEKNSKMLKDKQLSCILFSESSDSEDERMSGSGTGHFIYNSGKRLLSRQI